MKFVSLKNKNLRVEIESIYVQGLYLVKYGLDFVHVRIVFEER